MDVSAAAARGWRWVHRGEWTPGGTGWFLPLVFQLALVESAAVRGIGYYYGSAGTNLGRYENALPLVVWASLFLGSAIVIAAGMLTASYGPQIAGHAVAAAAYAGIGAGVFSDAVDNAAWEKLGSANGFVVLGVLFHAGFALGTAGQRKRREWVRALEREDDDA